jgi:hypothetical protein
MFNTSSTAISVPSGRLFGAIDFQQARVAGSNTGEAYMLQWFVNSRRSTSSIGSLLAQQLTASATPL